MSDIVTSLVVELIQILVDTGLAASNSEARRLIEQGAVRVDDKKITNVLTSINFTTGEPIVNVGKSALIQVGKRKFKRITFQVEIK